MVVVVGVRWIGKGDYRVSDSVLFCKRMTGFSRAWARSIHLADGGLDGVEWCAVCMIGRDGVVPDEMAGRLLPDGAVH